MVQEKKYVLSYWSEFPRLEEMGGEGESKLAHLRTTEYPETVTSLYRTAETSLSVDRLRVIQTRIRTEGPSHSFFQRLSQDPEHKALISLWESIQDRISELTVHEGFYTAESSHLQGLALGQISLQKPNWKEVEKADVERYFPHESARLLYTGEWTDHSWDSEIRSSFHQDRYWKRLPELHLLLERILDYP